MQLHGNHLVGFEQTRAAEPSFHGRNPQTGAKLDPGYAEASREELDRALSLATEAHRELRRIPAPRRADLLDRAAEAIEALGDELLARAEAETALPAARLTAERGRTTGQLRMFAALVREGSAVDARIDHPQPDRSPIAKPDLRQMQIGLGPIAVFGASNFPLAFSVAGGDTASAWAAGCPVVVKAHPHHPGTSELVGRALVDAVRDLDLPQGTFSMLHGAEHAVGLALVRHPDLAAVGFTGSLAGGRALFDAAMSRPVPIPVHAEMGSTNPVFLLPGALATRTESIALGLLQSVTLGVGQFCTKPGVVFALDDTATAACVAQLEASFSEAPAGTTLHAAIAHAYDRGLTRLLAVPGVRRAGSPPTRIDGRAAPALLVTDANCFATHPVLREEVFGPSTLIVLCPTRDAMVDAARRLQGQLTATVHGSDDDLAAFGDLIRLLEFRAGRVVFNGFPTGVEVCASMHHGGPYPATTDPRSTSVGTAAIRRFTRPICYQDAPRHQLPPELADDNPLGIPRLVDGKWTAP